MQSRGIHMITMSAQLPAFLQPKPTPSLVRLGRDNDGGYLVDPRDIAASDILLGFGIKDDWSFEKDFVAARDVPVYTFDPTVNENIFRKDIIKAAPRIDQLQLVVGAYRTWSEYKRFFSGDRHHIEKYVGKTSWPNSISLMDIRANVVPNGLSNIFLKIDIEGWEYRILGDILAISDDITGLVIEFHDVDLHLGRIEAFVRNLPLEICHVHGNNNVPLSEDGIPTVIECSFTRQTDGRSDVVLPHALDMPGNARQAEYALSFG